ncbi:kinase-like domain, phloem protein 2-like protein, partial [Tanacetum coccineum]
FPEGNCYMYEFGFKALVRAQFLSPQITYTVNLVFRHNTEQDLPKFMIKYRIDGEKKVLTVHETNKKEDGWFMAELHRCTSEHGTFEIMFECCWPTLLVAGIEFQPFEERVEDDQVLEYQDIIEAASHPFVYRSIEELKVLLSKGIYLNGYKTWFSLSENGYQCEMISIGDCLIRDDSNKNNISHYESHPLSRFPVGLYKMMANRFKVHVKTQFLSPLTIYTVNLVFHYSCPLEKFVYLGLQYKLEGEIETSTVYFADLREDGMYWAELYQFTSDGRSVDLVIIFEEIKDYIEVEGIMFHPFEKDLGGSKRVHSLLLSEKRGNKLRLGQVENQVLEDEKVDMQTVTDLEIMKVSKDRREWTPKKDLYTIFSRCFNNTREWFCVDKNGKKCLKLSARAACNVDNTFPGQQPVPIFRSGELLIKSGFYTFSISQVKSQVLSPGTTYACYLVYKSPQDQSVPVALMEVNKESDSWYIYLSSPPNTPVIGRELDGNTHNSFNRPKLIAVPRQRSDGWMEVKVWEFDTLITSKPISMYLTLRPVWSKYFSRISIQGIELRPIKDTSV